MPLSAVDATDLAERIGTTVIILGGMFWKGAQWVQRITDKQDSVKSWQDDHQKSDNAQFESINHKLDNITRYARANGNGGPHKPE